MISRSAAPRGRAPVVVTAPELADARWDGLVVLAAGMGWDDVTMSEKSLARALAAHAPLLYVEPPRSLRRGPRRSTLRAGDPGIAVLRTVVLPGLSRPVVRDVARWWHRRTISRTARWLAAGGTVSAAVAASLDHVTGGCGERRAILYGTDDWVSGAALLHQSTRWLARQERRQLARVDRVVAVSEVLARRWRDRGATVDVVPNGCDVDRLAAVDSVPVADAVRDLRGPVAAVVGHLSERIDLDLLQAVAATGVTLLLVGPYDARDPRVVALLAHPNVRAVGRVPSEDLPGYLRVVTVGLTPYADSEFNRASFPLKTLEYLAAGRRVVSTDLPATRDLATDLVGVASGPEAFAAAVQAALAEPLGDAERRRRREFAAGHSWTRRAQRVAEILELGPAQPGETAGAAGAPGAGTADPVDSVDPADPADSASATRPSIVHT